MGELDDRVAQARSWSEIQAVTKEYLVAQSRTRNAGTGGETVKRTGATGLLQAMKIGPDGLGYDLDLEEPDLEVEEQHAVAGAAGSSVGGGGGAGAGGGGGGGGVCLESGAGAGAGAGAGGVAFGDVRRNQGPEAKSDSRRTSKGTANGADKAQGGGGGGGGEEGGGGESAGQVWT